MAQELPSTPAFVLWRKAADKLLKMETALTRSRLAGPDLAPSLGSELQERVLEMRIEADALFRAAYAESSKVRSRRDQTTPARARSH